MEYQKTQSKKIQGLRLKKKQKQMEQLENKSK